MTSPSIIDTHCHLDFPAFDHDREAVLKRCAEKNIEHIIVPGVTAETWPRTIKLCSQYQQTHLALGMHPMFIDEHQPQHLNELDAAVQNNAPIAIGEIGLDYFQAKPNELQGKRNTSEELQREKQRLFFTKQLIIANHHQLPLIIHNRKAHDDCLHLLTQTSSLGGIIHAFNGSIQQAEKYIELGFLLGFGGMLTFERSSKLRKLVKDIPLSSIVLETDAPDMTVAQHKGERNSPEFVTYVLNEVANIKQVSTTEVAQSTNENVRRVFFSLSSKNNRT